MLNIHRDEVEQFALTIRRDFQGAVTVLRPRPNGCGEHLRASIDGSLLILSEQPGSVSLQTWCSDATLLKAIETTWRQQMPFSQAVDEVD